MADKEPVMVTWMMISVGVMAVVAGISLMVVIDRVFDLSLQPIVINPVGAAIGVAAWLAWVFRTRKKDR